jgi:hypothetical protein
MSKYEFAYAQHTFEGINLVSMAVYTQEMKSTITMMKFHWSKARPQNCLTQLYIPIHFIKLSLHPKSFGRILPSSGLFN